ncbi:MAG: hypothetical protein IKX33_07890 [Prevotella sp.]|nr:hypothetical protein [Prevotella sp.]
MAYDGPTWSAWDVCKQHWRTYLLVFASSLLLASVVVVSLPEEYSAQVTLADEHKETDLLLGLNNLAAWAKSTMTGHHGMRMPDAYHKIVMTRDFAVEMSKVPVVGYGTDYYHYTLEHAKHPWWERLFRSTPDSIEAYDEVISLINKRIRSKTSARYGTTVIQVTDNDPVVAAMMVDSVRVHLQRHTAGFARQTALFDLATAETKFEQAEHRYQSAREEYARYADSHNDLVSSRASAEEEHLQKEYESAFTAYEKAAEQRLRAQALVDKFSFTFTVLTNATVPLSSSSPSTLGYILSFVFIGLTVATWIILGRRKMLEFKLTRRQVDKETS